MNSETIQYRPASLWRRFAAMIYDWFLVAALLIVVSIPPVMLNGGAFIDGSPVGNIKNALFFVYLVFWVTAFYSWFWTHGGQTLGMTAWKIRVIGANNNKVSWRQAAIRCLCAILGLGNLSAPFNKERRGWHEHLSGTKTIHIERPR